MLQNIKKENTSLKMLFMSILYAFVIFFIEINQIETAKILAFFPTPSLSHQVTFYPIINKLVERGHDVTVVTTDPYYPEGKTPQNLTEISVHDISYAIWDQLLARAHKNINLRTQAYYIINTYTTLFENLLLVPEVQKLLKIDKNYFDLIILEACFRPGLILSHIFNAPLVQVSSFGALIHSLEGVGAPIHLFLYPTTLRKRIHNLSFWEKLKELLTSMLIRIFMNKDEQYLNELYDKHFGTGTPSVNELQNNIDMLMLNVNPMWAGNTPVPPAVVYTGGIHLKPPKELPQDLKSYLDSSKNGVIYMSFGTNVRSTSFTQIEVEKFINVLKNLPYDVLWRWDQEELPGRSENIKLTKWIPQSDLLRHPKIKLFITQGGLQSTDEAIVAGVPLIGVPMVADQWYNVEKYVYYKIGLKIDIENFTEEDFQEAINTVINDESYRKNVEKLRKQMYDQPQSPLERGVWWIEYLLRHGGAKHLRSPAANMSWAEYYEWKVTSFILVSLFVIVYILVKMMKYLWMLTMTLTKKVKLKVM